MHGSAAVSSDVSRLAVEYLRAVASGDARVVAIGVRLAEAVLDEADDARHARAGGE